ncbi:MAG: hypothetical protein Q8S19_07160, partial [Bacillota bacterium]|nr:hypothetical protein [Bacillota bacterium]
MKYCAACGLLPNDEGWFCPKCGKFVMQESALPAQEQIHTKADTIQSSLKTAAQLLTNTSTASSTSGEINFPIPLRNPDGLISAMGPFQCLLGGIINIFRGYRSALKDKKKWIPVTIMALLWLTMTLLPTMGVDVTSLKWLSWLTFANGGTTGSITAAVGGIIGKGLFAYLVTTVSISLGTRKNPFKGIWRIVKSIGGSLSLKNKSS